MEQASEDTMEIMDEYRCFGEYCPVPRMPKSFLMSGKRREAVEILYKQDELSDTETRGSPSPSYRERYDDRTSSPEAGERSSATNHSQFSPSAESAFNKIDKNRFETSASHTPTSPFTSTSGKAGLYPGLYPPMFPYPLGSMSGESGAHTSPMAFPYLYPQLTPPNAEDKLKNTESPDKNMFYYVDPRIPFTNYFLNLTRLLNNNSKSSSVTTPLGKMTVGDETRADDRESPMTPESPKSANLEHAKEKDKSRPRDVSPTAEKAEDAQNLTRELPGKLNIQTFHDQQLANPFNSALLSVSHPTPMIPMPSGGIFHPAMMHMHTSGGYRRFNPEKPPPVKKYKCDVCGKAFSRSNTLVTHKRIHTGDKPFKCEICARAFRQPGNLTRHRLTHTTVKPYVCPTCNKAFNRASNLHTHMRTHTSFKAFICPYCGKGFHQKIDMKIHCYTHTAHTNRAEPPRM